MLWIVKIAKEKEYCMKVDICANCTGEANGAGDHRCLACTDGSDYVEVSLDTPYVTPAEVYDDIEERL